MIVQEDILAQNYGDGYVYPAARRLDATDNDDDFYRRYHENDEGNLVLYGKPKVVNAAAYPWIHTGAVIIDHRLLPTLEVYLEVQDEDNEKQKPIFLWWATMINETSVEISIEFENPLYVSKYQNLDILVIKINDQRLFTSDNAVMIERELTIRLPMPKQFESAAIGETVTSATETYGDLLQGALSIHIIVSLSQNVSLNQLLSFVKSM